MRSTSLALTVVLAGCGSPAPEWPVGARLDVAEVTGSTVTVTWAGAAHAEAYVVRLDGAPIARLGAEARSYAATELAEASAHVIEVAALGADGVASSPLRVGATTNDTTAPSFAQDAQVELTVGGEGVELRWPEASDNVAVTTYRVLRDREDAVRVDGLRAELDGPVTDGTRFEVRALDAAGNESVALVHTYEAPRAPEPIGARAQVESLLLGAFGLGDATVRGPEGAATRRADDLREQLEGVAVSRAPDGERGGGTLSEDEGGIGGLRRAGGELVASPRGHATLDTVAQAAGPGAMDAALVQRMLRLRLTAVTRCYERVLRDTPTREGSVRLRFTIAPTGAVTGARVLEGLSPELDECVVRIVRTLRNFEPPEGGPATFDATYTFRPRT